MKNKKHSKMQRNRIIAGIIAGVLIISMVLGLVVPFLF